MLRRWFAFKTEIELQSRGRARTNPQESDFTPAKRRWLLRATWRRDRDEDWRVASRSPWITRGVCHSHSGDELLLTSRRRIELSTKHARCELRRTRPNTVIRAREISVAEEDSTDASSLYLRERERERVTSDFGISSGDVNTDPTLRNSDLVQRSTSF